MSPFINLNFLLKCFNFPKPPLELLSKTITLQCFFIRSYTILDPMKPVPPVTR